jgi:hypothetical protein
MDNNPNAPATTTGPTPTFTSPRSTIKLTKTMTHNGKGYPRYEGTLTVEFDGQTLSVTRRCVNSYREIIAGLIDNLNRLPGHHPFVSESMLRGRIAVDDQSVAQAAEKERQKGWTPVQRKCASQKRW